MSDEEDYDSSEDEDYAPSDGEAVSEEENSGEEENLEALKEDGEPVKTGNRKRKPVKQKSADSRKRIGGIKLDDENTVIEEEGQGDANKELANQIKLEQQEKKTVQEKKRADDLWSSFMSDVGKRPEKKPVPSSGLGSSSDSIKSSPTKTPTSTTTVMASVAETKPSKAAPKSTITVTKVYDFAGESIKVTKEIDVNTKEGKAELKKQEEQTTEPNCASEEEPATSTPIGMKRPSGGLGGVLDKINKKPKLGTLEKSKMDWEEFKEKEGINEELKIHNRGKQSYIERMHFLQRTDQRQFELEKNLRLGTSSKR